MKVWKGRLWFRGAPFIDFVLSRRCRLGYTFLCLAVYALTGAACGYRLGGMPCEQSLATTRKVAIPMFKNESFEPRAENLFTESFREQIQEFPCFSLSLDHEADALLMGTIFSVTTYPVAVNQDFLAVQYGMRAVVSVCLVSRPEGKILWCSPRVEEEVRFHALPDAQMFQDNNREALTRLSWKMAGRILEQLVLGF